MAGTFFKKGVRFLSIRSKLSLSLVVISIISLIFSAVVSYQLASDRVMNISMRLSAQSMLSQGETFQTQIINLQQTTTTLIQSDSLHALANLSAPTSADCDRNEKGFGAIAKEMTNSVASSYTFDFIGIYLSNGYTYETDTLANSPYESYEECSAFYAERGNFVIDNRYINGQWIPSEQNRSGEDVLAYVRFLYERSSLKKIGIVVFALYEPHLKSAIDIGTSDCFLVTPSGLLLSGTNQFSAGEQLPEASNIISAIKHNSNNQVSSYYKDMEGKTRIISFYHIWQINAYLVAPFEYYEDIRNQEMSEYVQTLLLLASAEVTVMIILGVLLGKGLTKSVFSLVSFTKSIGIGDATQRYIPTSNDEISILGEQLNTTLDQLQLANEQKEAEMAANQAITIQLLQQQINPHLLYNTLDSLLWSLQQKHFKDAIPLVSSLSEFFKISLSQGKEMIPLADEIRVIEHFLNLQRLARRKDFQLITDIPQELLSVKINKLTLQPLVENAVMHGFSGYRNDGKIAIRAVVQKDILEICVEDNGIGMTPDELETVNSSIRKFPRPDDFPHFGLYNINRRIIQTYGEGYGLTVESEISDYTRIILRIPTQ